MVSVQMLKSCWKQSVNGPERATRATQGLQVYALVPEWSVPEMARADDQCREDYGVENAPQMNMATRTEPLCYYDLY